MEIHELGRDIIKRALRKGCDQAEVYIKESSGISAEVKDGEVEALEASKDFGFSLRVMKNKRLGFAFSTDVDDFDVIIDKAVESADYTAGDKYNELPDAGAVSDVQIYDEASAAMTEEEIIGLALELERSARDYDERIRKVRKSEVGAGTGRTLIVNSRGVDASYRSSYCSAHTTVIAEDGKGDSQMGWDYAGSRRRTEIDVALIGRSAAQRAIELLGSRRIGAVKVPVILVDHVAVDFLEILSASLSADAVQKGRSFLHGKVGQQVMSSILNIVDDGSIPWGVGTSPVDDEGVPSGRKLLIENGVLKGFIHNTYTAKKDGTSSTGNAVRRGATSLPGVGVTNFFIESTGTRSRSELVSSMSKGLVILSAMGVHTADPISGDFSIGISGIWIEDGKESFPVKEAVISGNILDLFRKAEETGSDLRFYGGTGSPSLLVGEMDISA